MDMTEDEVQAERRKKLESWINANGGASAACKKRGLAKATESYISQILSGYSFGGRAARNMEKKLGIAEFSLEPQSLTQDSINEGSVLGTIGALLDELPSAMRPVVEKEILDLVLVRWRESKTASKLSQQSLVLTQETPS